MKICICSDSHGNWRGLQEMVEREAPAGVYFLGDGLWDWNRVTLPQQTIFLSVCGNCDFAPDEPALRQMEWYGARIGLTHGHLLQVKSGLYRLQLLAQQENLQWIFYGHTHQAKQEEVDGCCFVCPGSMSRGDEHYAVLTLEPEGIRCDLRCL